MTPRKSEEIEWSSFVRRKRAGGVRVLVGGAGGGGGRGARRKVLLGVHREKPVELVVPENLRVDVGK